MYRGILKWNINAELYGSTLWVEFSIHGEHALSTRETGFTAKRVQAVFNFSLSMHPLRAFQFFPLIPAVSSLKLSEAPPSSIYTEKNKSQVNVVPFYPYV